VQRKGKWYFDAKLGREEVLLQRIGANELDVLEICRGYVDAQEEYAMQKHDASTVNQYAQRIISTPGKQDGLAWKNPDGTWGGPVGENVADALEQGYSDKSKPYHGYYFKVLKGQGPAAPMGEMDFVVEGNMIGGFALAAAPAEYRVTGVQTFIVNQSGVVYQKDLGPDTLKVFKEMEQTLPLPTLFLIGSSTFLKSYWWVLLLFAMMTVFLFRLFVSTPRGRSWWDLIKLKIPVIGPVSQKIILARFASTLASLSKSGVEFMVAMGIVRTLVNNVRIAEVIDEAIEHIRKGKSMTVALSASPWFPPMFVQMIAVGEQSGNLEGMLNKIANAYERDVETAIKAMTSLLEPLMITVMGLAVGFIVISILLPIFEMNQMIR